MVYVPDMPKVDIAGAVGGGFDLGQKIGGARDKRKAKNALKRIYEGDKSALAELKALDPEAGRAVETEMGVRQFIKPAGPETELAGPVRPGVDEPLTTRVPASVDTEGLTGYLASRGDSGALKALIEKAGPQAAAKWGYSKESAINPQTGQEEYFITDESGNVKWLGIKPKPEEPKVEKPQEKKTRLVQGIDPNTGQLVYEVVEEGQTPTVRPQTTAPAASEDERKAAGWYQQMDKANADMDAAIAMDQDAAKPGVVESLPLIPEALKNTSRSAARQKFVQAASAFAEAALRAATGAGINESEAKQKIAELTPQWGDTPEVIKQKRASLSMYMDAVKARAARALGNRPQGPQVSGIVMPEGIPPIPDRFAAGRNNPKYVEYWIARHQQTKADGSPMTAADRRRIDERARQNGVIK